MSEPVISKESISRIAMCDAIKYAQSGLRPVNPFPFCSAAAMEWDRRFNIAMVRISAPEAEAA